MTQLFGAMKTAFSSFYSINQAIQTTSDNIANANNENYNRQIETYEDQRFGGVKISDVIRLADEGMMREYLGEVTHAGKEEVLKDVYDQIEQTTGGNLSKSYLSDAVQSLSDAWKVFEASPENYAAEQEVIRAAYELQTEFERLSSGVAQIESQLENDIVDNVAEINEILDRIDSINDNIVRDKSRGLAIAEYQNMRDQKLVELAEYMQVQTFTRSNGSMSVYSSAGLVLVDQDAAQLEWDRNTTSLTLSGQSGNLVGTSLMPDGALSARINMLRTDIEAVDNADFEMAPIQKLRNTLDDLAYSFVDDATAATRGSLGMESDGLLTDLNGIDFGESFTIQTSYIDEDGDTQLGTLHTITIEEGMTAQDLVDLVNDFTYDGDTGGDFGEPVLRAQLTAHGTLEIGTTSDNIVQIDYADFNTQDEGSFIDQNGTILVDADGNTITNVTRDDAGNIYVDGELTTVYEVQNSTGVLSALGLTDSATTLTTEKRDPPTFANAYNNAELQDGEAAYFFRAEDENTPLGVSRVNFEINPDLFNGSLALKDFAGNAVMDAINSDTRDMVGSGVRFTNHDYVSLASGILTDVSARAFHATTAASDSMELRDGLASALRDKVGVDIDEEMLRLSVLENSYAATARAVDTIQKMFDALEAAV